VGLQSAQVQIDYMSHAIPKPLLLFTLVESFDAVYRLHVGTIHYAVSSRLLLVRQLAMVIAVYLLFHGLHLLPGTLDPSPIGEVHVPGHLVGHLLPSRMH